MKRRLLLALSIILVASGLFLLVRVIYSFKDIEKGGLQVTANIKGRVLLDNKYIGDIPVRKINQPDTVTVGNYELRIEPEDKTHTAFGWSAASNWYSTGRAHLPLRTFDQSRRPREDRPFL